MKRTNKREREKKGSWQDIPNYSVVQCIHSVPHRVCQILGR